MEVDYEAKIRRLFSAALFVLSMLIGSSAVYYLLCHGTHSYLDCLYMSVITVSTVGYGEIIPVDTAALKAFTMFLVISGTGGTLYLASVVTAFMIEGDLTDLLTRHRVQNRINKLSGHVIVCGIGSTGRHTAHELSASGVPFVSVELDMERIARLSHDLGDAPHLWIHGDAEDDEILERAGIRRARALICALPKDPNNLYLVVGARKLNPDLVISSRVVQERSGMRLLRAGADHIVAPNMIGGRDLAVRVMHPEATNLLDMVIRDPDQSMRFDEVTVEAGSALADTDVRDSQMRERYHALLVAVRDQGDQTHFAPGPNFRIAPGMVLMVFGERAHIPSLRAAACNPTRG